MPRAEDSDYGDLNPTHTKSGAEAQNKQLNRAAHREGTTAGHILLRKKRVEKEVKS